MAQEELDELASSAIMDIRGSMYTCFLLCVRESIYFQSAPQPKSIFSAGCILQFPQFKFLTTTFDLLGCGNSKIQERYRGKDIEPIALMLSLLAPFSGLRLVVRSRWHLFLTILASFGPFLCPVWASLGITWGLLVPNWNENAFRLILTKNNCFSNKNVGVKRNAAFGQNA